MATQPFTTYFGDYMLGLFITWETVATGGGQTQLNLTMVNHLRAKLIAYGSELLDKPTLNANDVFVNYSTVNVGEVFPESTNAKSQTFQQYVVWLNPDSAAAVTYDGIMVKTYATIQTPAAGGDPVKADDFKILYMDNSTTGERFDIKPSQTYTNSVTSEDVQQGGQNNVDFNEEDGVDVTTKDVCTEKWLLSETSIACVEITTKVKRAADTEDVDQDFVLNMASTYTMHAQVGRVSDISDSTTKFAQQDVDFS